MHGFFRTARIALLSFLAMAVLPTQQQIRAASPDLILHHARIVTVDADFSIQEALAVEDGRILRMGGNEEVMALGAAGTRLIDAQGKMVLPGLIDSHTHPGGACMTEFDHELPTMESVADVLGYVRDRAGVLPEGEWIVLQQVFITRLRERRYPTREELDQAAPRHPVVFRTGPDASLNTRALRHFEITGDTPAPDGSKIEKNDRGEPTGILRNWSSLISIPSSGKAPEETDHERRLAVLLRDYATVGLTAIADRSASAEAVERYARLKQRGELPVRVALSHYVSTQGDVKEVIARIAQVAEHPLCRGDAKLRMVGIKTFLDGGMLTGSAYMRQPWGVSEIYAIDDPEYRGLRFIEQDKLVALVRAAAERGLQFTAHSVGDGAVHALIDAYETVGREMPLRRTRPCITHCNFMSREAVEKMAELGIVADIQPAWLWLDTATLHRQFGYERMRWFQPLRSLFENGVVAGGGTDHMQKIGSMRSINPYNPWLGMWITITRRAQGFEGRLHPEEALTREQAVRFYTINNARLLFLEDQVGTLEEGKRADFIVIDRDILACPVDEIPATKVLQTYVDGKLVYETEGRGSGD